MKEDEFAMHLGIISGMFQSHETVEYLQSKGVSENDIKAITGLLRSIAYRCFYKKSEE